MRVFGVQWEPIEFLQKAVELKRPALPAEVYNAILTNVDVCPSDIACKRAEFFRFWEWPGFGT